MRTAVVLPKPAVVRQTRGWAARLSGRMFTSQHLGLGGIRRGVGSVEWLFPSAKGRNPDFLLSGIAAEELTKSCANSFKLCSINCTQPVSHDVLSSLSRLAESGADPLQRRGMRGCCPYARGRNPLQLLHKSHLMLLGLAELRIQTLQCTKTHSGGGVREPHCPVFWCTPVPRTCALPGPAAPGIALRTSQGLSPAGPAHLCARCRTQGHSCQAGFLAKLLAQLCVWINYEICMSFTELQSNQSTLSGEELERGSALDCIKLRASTRLLNPSLWGPQSLVSSGCGGRYPCGELWKARPGQVALPLPPAAVLPGPGVGEVAVNSWGGTFQLFQLDAKLKLLTLGYLQPRGNVTARCAGSVPERAA